jgi:chemotaxis protein MotD
VAVRSLTDQLNEAVRAALAEAAVGGPDWEPATTAHARPAAGETNRILDLSLQPAELGSIRVRLALREATLRVELVAAKSETVRWLAEEQSQLGTRLEAAGYTLEALAISAAGGGTADPIARDGFMLAGGMPEQLRSGTPGSGREPNEGASPKPSRHHLSAAHDGSGSAQPREDRGGVYI